MRQAYSESDRNLNGIGRGGRLVRTAERSEFLRKVAANSHTPNAFPGGQCHQLKTIDGLFYAKTVEMQPQLVGAGLCSARQNAVNSFENLRRIRKQLPLWM